MLITQEVLNRLKQYELDKRRNKDYAGERRVHNEKLKDYVQELEILE